MKVKAALSLFLFISAANARYTGSVTQFNCLKKDTGHVLSQNNLSGNQAGSAGLSKGLTGKVTGIHTNTVRKDTTLPGCRMICRKSATGHGQPLLVVDGEVVKLSGISQINPNEIEDIRVLKGVVGATVYGSAGANGVLVLTTKKNRIRKFSISSFLNNWPVSGANARFINTFSGDTLQLHTGNDGLITTSQLVPDAEYRVLLTAAGYLPVYLHYRNGNTKKIIPWQMERAVMGSSGDQAKQAPAAGESIPGRQIELYPVPVARGANLQIKLGAGDAVVRQLRLVSPAGITMFRQTLQATNETRQTITLQTGSGWPAGIYFIQFFCEKGRILASEKVIIQ